MSGMEVVAILGTVAAVISAFEHGSGLVKKIKDKRAAKKAVLPPPMLEQSLVRGPRAVSEAYEDGVETYGQAFRVENDRIALDAFKDIVINLQGVLLRHLVAAQDDDSMNDFGAVLDASNFGRVRSVHVLNEMYMRMAQSAPMPGYIGQLSGQQQSMLEAQRTQYMLPTNAGFGSASMPGLNWTSPPQRSFTEVTNSTLDSPRHPMTGVTALSPSGQQDRFSPSVTSHPSHQASVASAYNNERDNNDPNQSPVAARKGLRSVLTSPKPQKALNSRDDPREHLPRPPSTSSDGRSLTSSSSASMTSASPDTVYHPHVTSPSQYLHHDRHGNKIPMHESPPAGYRKRLNNKPKAKRAKSSTSAASRPELSPSKSSGRKFSFPIRSAKQPIRDNGGFCDGATLMRTGNDGMKLRNQSVSMTGQNNYWACSNSMCCYEGPAVQTRDEHNKIVWGFDLEIREAYGVRYRWSFLAKSHTAIGNSKKGFEYQCAFCAGQGGPCFKTKDERPFIQHVATHQGQRPDRFKMFLLNYVVGRRALDEESFDVNLGLPLDDIGRTEEKTSGSPGLGIEMGTNSTVHHQRQESTQERIPPIREPVEVGTPALNGGGDDLHVDRFWREDQDAQPNGDYLHAHPSSTMSPIRDSTISLQPAPLFARFPAHTRTPISNFSTQQGVQTSKINNMHENDNEADDENQTSPAEDVVYNEEVDIATSPSCHDVHPAFRATMISIPDPWRTSYATLDSRKGSVAPSENWNMGAPVGSGREGG